MDAPIHFGEGRHTVDEIPIERLVAPAVVIDVSEAAADVYGLENLMNPGRLPATDATIIALSMKIAGGSGAPVRVIALLP